MAKNQDVDKVAEFIVKVPVKYTTIFLIILPITITVITSYFPKYEEKIKSAVLNFTAFTGVASLLILVRDKKIEAENNIESKKIDRSLEYISEWTKMTSLYLGQETSEFIAELEQLNEKERLNKINETFETNKSVRKDVIAILNHFEKLGIAVQSEEADDSKLAAYYRNLILKYHSLFSPWISLIRTESRVEDSERYFISFEGLRDQWKDKK